MQEQIRVEKVRLVIFNMGTIARTFGLKAKICWKTDKSGTIVRRNPNNGRFMSQPFNFVQTYR